MEGGAGQGSSNFTVGFVILFYFLDFDRNIEPVSVTLRDSCKWCFAFCCTNFLTCIFCVPYLWHIPKFYPYVVLFYD